MSLIASQMHAADPTLGKKRVAFRRSMKGPLNPMYGKPSVLRELRKDPLFEQKRWKNLRLHPNRPEKQLQHLLDKAFPDEWRFTGDGSLIIGGLNPDFTNCQGKKFLIELFGTHWHNRYGLAWHQTELGRVMAFNALGFQCLVIWEHELDDEDSLRKKVIVFMKAKKRSTPI